MNNKNILIALTPEIREEGLLNFMATYLYGDNIRLVLCIIDGENESPQIDGLLDRISLFCEQQDIDVKIRHLVKNMYEELENLTAYSDLLIINKKALRHLRLSGDLEEVSCAMMVLPEDFVIIKNALFFMDGSKEATAAIKQFAQTFSSRLSDLDITIISSQHDAQYEKMLNGESLLLDYLKQYAQNIGILKVRGPLTDRLLKPIEYSDRTLVIGSNRFLLSQYGEHSSFKPFFDESSSIFLPAD